MERRSDESRRSAPEEEDEEEPPDARKAAEPEGGAGAEVEAEAEADGEEVEEKGDRGEGDSDRKYVASIAEHVRHSSGKRDEIGQWYSSRGETCDLEEHVARVFAASGITQLAGRLELVRMATHRQQQLLLERKNRKRLKERLREAAGMASRLVHEEELGGGVGAGASAASPERRPTGGSRASALALPPLPVVEAGPDIRVSRSAPSGMGAGGRESGAERHTASSHRASTAAAAPGALTRESGLLLVPFGAAEAPPPSAGTDEGSLGLARGDTWSKVQDFKTHEEALRFVMECQPIDYRPAGLGNEEVAFPRYESTRDAFEHVRRMLPPPSEFVSAESEFHRRLRVRRLEQHEMRELAAPVASVRRGRTGKGLPAGKVRGSRLAELVSAAQEMKPWLVEAAGMLFTRPASLRALHREAGMRYFIAVTPEVEKKVLVEGFRVRRRCSIPCAGTPKEALAAFTSNEQRAGRPLGLRASVLAVSFPADSGVDIVAHKRGGFLIRCKELPPGYFSRVRRLGGGEAS